MNDNVIYFPRHNKNMGRIPGSKIIFDLIPKSKKESYKANMAMEILNIEQYTYYLALVLIYQAFHLMPERHKEYIKNLVDFGILDEIATLAKTELTNNYVSAEGEFFYNNKEFRLPEGHIPRMRINVDENIYVETFNDEGERRIYQFTYYNDENYMWEEMTHI